MKQSRNPNLRFGPSAASYLSFITPYSWSTKELSRCRYTTEKQPLRIPHLHNYRIQQTLPEYEYSAYGKHLAKDNPNAGDVARDLDSFIRNEIQRLIHDMPKSDDSDEHQPTRLHELASGSTPKPQHQRCIAHRVYAAVEGLVGYHKGPKSGAPRSACILCVNAGRPCIMVFWGSILVVLPLPQELHSEGSTPHDKSWYIWANSDGLTWHPEHGVAPLDGRSWMIPGYKTRWQKRIYYDGSTTN